MKPAKITFDPLYGFIKLTETEDKIIRSPFYQRLRWIKQLGFSNYIFPGGEHNRFIHAMGAMHMADQMLRAIGLAVPDENLYNVKALDPETKFHKVVRIAALLHDIGTFPFSHTCEGAYIKHGESSHKPENRGKNLPNSHEHLGAYILKNTNFAGGITKILEDDGLDFNEISHYIKGESGNLLANQILHSDLDADRMDYLMRDAYYTGVKYGQFDRDYIVYHLTTFNAGGGKRGLAIKENALHAVEDFLIARFGWYSQIIRASGGAKFDIIAEVVTKYFLEKQLMWQFQDVLDMVASDPDRFFGFNDFYFMGLLHKYHLEKNIKNPKIREMIQMLLYRQSPIEVQLPLFEHKLITSDEDGMHKRELLVKKINETVLQFEEAIKTHGNGTEWILHDIPDTDILFAKNVSEIVRKRNSDLLFQERDPIKIVDPHGNVNLLVDRDNSIIRILSNVGNFIPVIYMNRSAHELLTNIGLLEQTKRLQIRKTHLGG